MMELGLPKDCVSLYAGTQKNDEPVNIMGIVTDAMPPAPTRGTDWQITFSLEDESYGSRYQVKFFHRQNELPPISGTGDVIHLKGIPYKEVRQSGFKIFLGQKTTRWTLFSLKDIPQEPTKGSLNLPFKVDSLSKSESVAASQEEMKYAITLCSSKERNEFKSFGAGGPELDAGAGVAKDKGCLVEDIREGLFCDLVGQVIDTYDQDDRLIIYFTDCTNNKLLFNYGLSGSKNLVGDEYGYLPVQRGSSEWKGPEGQFTLMVTTWEPHRSWCLKHVQNGDFVELNNIRVKFGKGDHCRLEGAIHGSKYDTSTQPRIKKLVWDKEHPDQRLKSFLQRRRAHVKNFGDWREDISKKRKADEATKQDTKSVNSKKRARQKDNAKKGLSDEARIVDNRAATGDGIPPLRRNVRKAQDTLNEEVVCSRDSHPVTYVSSILNQLEHNTFTTSKESEGVLPWQNRRRRADLRVVDFFPPDIRSFAVRELVSEFDGIDDDEDGPQATLRPKSADGTDSEVSDNSDDESAAEGDENEDQENAQPEATQAAQDNLKRGYRYVWRFALLVEDRKTVRASEPARMVLHVGGDDAIFLLDGLLANDLYKKKNQRLLGKLREKLFILWGDLEEQKQEASGAKGEAKGTNGAAKVGSNLTKPNNLPFSCCVEEYAIRLPGPLPRYERRFALFGTRIK